MGARAAPRDDDARSRRVHGRAARPARARPRVRTQVRLYESVTRLGRQAVTQYSRPLIELTAFGAVISALASVKTGGVTWLAAGGGFARMRSLGPLLYFSAGVMGLQIQGEACVLR